MIPDTPRMTSSLFVFNNKNNKRLLVENVGGLHKGNIIMKIISV